MQQFIWPPTPVSIVGGATSANQVIEIARLDSIITLVTGKSYITSARLDYSSTNVNTSTWVQLVASTASTAQGLYIFDSSGQTMELGFGAAASEARKFLIQPGGPSGFVPLLIPASTRLSVRAVSATANAGEIDITLLG